jgi:hypothetical protein
MGIKTKYLPAGSMWTKREFPTERVDKLMENDKAVSHKLIHTNSPFVHIAPQKQIASLKCLRRNKDSLLV